MNEVSRLLVSFSGGRTSAHMLERILALRPRRYRELVVTFANTGCEHPATLDFVRDFARHVGCPVVWLEAEVHLGERKATTHRVVSYETASRNGEPFERMIEKYGVPNTKFKHCTRTLKQHPIENYARSIGWAKGSYHTAIGIRTDEADRVSVQARQRGLVYPFLEWYPTSKADVAAWAEACPVRLPIKGYEGNCVWCWKKSFRKHITLARENSSWYDFPARMERDHGGHGPEFLHDRTKHREPLPLDYRRVFFRGGKATIDILDMARNPPPRWTPAADDYALEFDADLDVGGGCEESCEVYADEDNAEEFLGG